MVLPPAPSEARARLKRCRPPPQHPDAELCHPNRLGWGALCCGAAAKPPAEHGDMAPGGSPPAGTGTRGTPSRRCWHSQSLGLAVLPKARILLQVCPADGLESFPGARGPCSCPVLRDEAGTHPDLGLSWRLRKLFPPDLRVCSCYPHGAHPHHPPGQETRSSGQSQVRLLRRRRRAGCAPCTAPLARVHAEDKEVRSLPRPPPPLPICPCC